MLLRYVGDDGFRAGARARPGGSPEGSALGVDAPAELGELGGSNLVRRSSGCGRFAPRGGTIGDIRYIVYGQMNGET